MAKAKARRGKRADQAPAPRPYSEDLSLADECRRLAFIPFPPPARITVTPSVDLRTGPFLTQLFGFLLVAVALMSGPDAESKPRPKPTTPTTIAPTSSARAPGTVINPMTLPDAKPKPPAGRSPQGRPRLPSAPSGLPARR